MKENSRSNIWALAVAGSILFIIACNNSDYTKNPPANNDTTMSNAPKRDTASSNVSARTKNKNSAISKKRRVSIGKMTETKTSAMKPDKDGIYDVTDVRPAYPGGQTALANYINNNIAYQEPAIDNITEGTVDVQFVVDENGKVSDVKRIGKELGGGLDDQAVAVISNMPKWTPGKVKGKNVKTRLVLPITYKIEQ